MSRVFLSYLGNSMALPEGESFVGRDLQCRMRFNDPIMSRKHLSLLVEDGQVVIKDLGSRNGTELNGRRLVGTHRASHGDVIKIGSRELQILEGEGDDDFVEEVTATGTEVGARHARQATLQIRTQRCPECCSKVSVFDDECASCGYAWADFRPRSSTKVVTDEQLPAKLAKADERRRDPRLKVRVPVLYSSETLDIESHAVDLSRSGVFIRTQLLEPIETLCSITMLVDGAPALTFRGKVSRVVEVDGGDEQPLGLGIQFVEMGTDALGWLDTALAKAAANGS